MAKSKYIDPEIEYKIWKGEIGPGAQLKSMGLNPDYDPNSDKIRKMVRNQIESEEPFDSRESRKKRWAKLYTKFKKELSAPRS